MGIGAGCKLLHPRHTDALRIRVQRLRLSRRKIRIRPLQESRPQDLLHGLLFGRIPEEPGIQFFPLLIQSLPAVSHPFRHGQDPRFLRKLPTGYLPLLFVRDLQVREKPADVIYQIGRPDALALR